MFCTVRRKTDYGNNFQDQDQAEDRLTQTLVFPKFSYIYRNTWCLNLLRNIMMESAVTAHAKGKDYNSN